MNTKTYRRILVGVTMTLSAIISYSVVNQQPLIAISAVFIMILVIMYARSRTTEVIADERTSMINEKSATYTLTTSVIVIVAAGLVLVFLFGEKYRELGYALSYLSCGILLLQSLFRFYFARKYG